VAPWLAQVQVGFVDARAGRVLRSGFLTLRQGEWYGAIEGQSTGIRLLRPEPFA
jgi:hypothetical protein